MRCGGLGVERLRLQACLRNNKNYGRYLKGEYECSYLEMQRKSWRLFCLTRKVVAVERKGGKKRKQLRRGLNREWFIGLLRRYRTRS